MSNTIVSLFGLSLLVCLSVHAVATPQLTVYWGQNSNNQEKQLSNYCQDDTYDIIVVAFVIGFPGTGSADNLWMNLANHCETPDPTYPNLLSCPAVGNDITFCQQRGKKVVLSFGGAVGNYGFSSDSQAQTFAQTVWDMFLGGSGSVRPFGNDVILDGVDLDIEAGSATGYAAFANALRAKFVGASKNYYISAAPQCPYPDAFLGPSTGSAFQGAWFDYVWVQFYNNYCGLNAYPSQFNFNSWATWAQTQSVNKNVQIFIGAPASHAAAGSGYVTAATLQTITTAISTQYGNVFGGVMLWDAGNSDANGNFGGAVASFLKGISVSAPSTPSTPSMPSTTSKPKKTPTTGHAQLTSGVLTTGHAVLTTGSKKIATTASHTSGILVRTTGAPVRTTGHSARAVTSSSVTSSASHPSSSSSGPIPATCVIGHMVCSSSESYQTCAPTVSGQGAFGVHQECPFGLHCSQNGNWIYCV